MVIIIISFNNGATEKPLELSQRNGVYCNKGGEFHVMNIVWRINANE